MDLEPIDGWLLSGAEIVHDTPKIAMTAERDDERDAVADRRPSGSHDCHPSGKADAAHANPPIRSQALLLRQPGECVLNDVSGPRRDHVIAQVGQGHRHDGYAASSQISGEPPQPWLVDARGVD